MAQGQAREVSSVQTHGEDIPKPGKCNSIGNPRLRHAVLRRGLRELQAQGLLEDVEDPLMPSYAKDPSESHVCTQQRPEFHQVGPRPPRPFPLHKH